MFSHRFNSGRNNIGNLFRRRVKHTLPGFDIAATVRLKELSWTVLEFYIPTTRFHRQSNGSILNSGKNGKTKTRIFDFAYDAKIIQC